MSSIRSSRSRVARHRLALALACVVTLLAVNVNPVLAQTDESDTNTTPEDTRTQDITPVIELVKDNYHSVISGTEVDDNFIVRVRFGSDPRIVSGISESTLSVTGGTITKYSPHSSSHVGFWEISADNNSETVTVSVAAGAVDGGTRTNPAASVTYTNTGALTVAISIAEGQTQPIVGDSFIFEIEFSEAVPTASAIENRHQNFQIDDIEASIPQRTCSGCTRRAGIDPHVGDGDTPTFGRYTLTGFSDRPQKVKVWIPAGVTAAVSSDQKFNRASNVLEVWVNPFFTIEGDAPVTAFVGAPETTVLETFSVSDSEADVTWALTGDDADNFTLNSDGELRFNSTPNLDTGDTSASYDITVSATTDHYTDRVSGSYTNSGDFVVELVRPFQVQGADADNPRIELLELSTKQVVDLSATNHADNQDGTVTWELLGDDAEYFTISDDGEVSFRDLPRHGTRPGTVDGSKKSGNVSEYRFDVTASSHDYVPGIDSDSGGYVWQKAFAVEIRPAGAYLEGYEVVNADTAPFVAGDTIQVRADFVPHANARSLRVALEVEGSPQLALDIGGEQRLASYVAGTGESSGKLLFGYTVVADDLDLDGVEVAENGIRLNGGTITGVEFLPAALGSDSVHLTDAVVGQPFFVDGEDELKVQPGNTQVGSYSISVTDDESINADLTFVWELSGDDAALSTISDAGVLSFIDAPEYDVDLDDDEDGIYEVTLEATSTNFSVSSDGDTYTASLAVSVEVTEPPATIDRFVVNGSPANGTHYIVGETITVRMWLNGGARGTDELELVIDVGGVERRAAYDGGDQVVHGFVYTVQEGDSDSDGISIPANAVRLNGGTLNDRDGFPTVLTHAAAGPLGKPVGVAPPPATSTTTTTVTTITNEAVGIASVAVTSTPNTGSSYGASESIVVSLTFNDDVTVADMTGATVELQIGDNTRTATYTGIDAQSRVLSFSYTVAIGDSDPDGVEVKANSLTLNGGTIQDSAGNDASLAHAAFSAGSGHKVSAAGGL